MIPTFGDMFSADIFAEFGRTKCKILANFGVGINHINVAAARDHGITVTNTPGAVTDATADIGLTLLLMSARRAGEGERLAGIEVSGDPVKVDRMTWLTPEAAAAAKEISHFGLKAPMPFFIWL